MEEHIVRIIETGNITHDVKFIRVKKPVGYSYKPGQATDVSINKEGMKDELRAFTFTSLTDASYLEFIIKKYPSHNGVTEAIHRLVPDDELILHEVFGDISYKGKGLFIAGGAGVTPFISILRDLNRKNELSENKLIFANRTSSDIILAKELDRMLGNNLINILSDEKNPAYQYGFIEEELLKKHISGSDTKIYLCGPPAMMENVLKHLKAIGYPEEEVVMDPV